MKNPVTLFSIFLALVLILVGLTLSDFEKERKFMQKREEVFNFLGSIKSSVENRLYWNIHRTEGIRSLVAMNPDLTQEDFARAISVNFEGEHDLRNIGLSKGFVIKYMYPLEGNEAAVGLDFTQNSAQFTTADRARKLKKTVLAGPLQLVQGGEGIIARIPIYHSNEFWGLASVVLNMDNFYEKTGLLSLPPNMRVSIRGKDSLGEQGEVFFGESDLFSIDSVRMKVDLPTGSWELAAYPLEGWAENNFIMTPLLLAYIIVGISLFLINIIMGFLFGRLKRAQKEAQNASKAKSEFLANMSHEIPTPLNGVIGFTELLKNTSLSSIQAQYVNNANISGKTLLGIINDILDFSKIEAGMLHIEMIKTDIIELLTDSIDIVKYQADKKKLELLLNIEPSLPRFAVTDPIRLKQILANLLGNAIKFTENGEIELKVNYAALNNGLGTLSFFIRDTGIGISEEQKNKLFKAFSQADSSTTRKFGGTGLGLIISDLIAKKLGGKIMMESSLGDGSTFSFELTTKVEQGEPKEIGSIDQIKRCLIIDDNASNRKILGNLLSSWNIVTESCDNGLSGLKLLETSEPFDVVICDYIMPYFDGLDTIGLIREKLKLTPEEQPIILLHSLLEDVEIHKKCYELGVPYILTKPVKSYDLYSTLCQIKKTSNKGFISFSATPKEEIQLSNTINILITEDVVMNMIMIKALIKKIYPKAILHEAINGREAVRLAKEINPDIIFMDIQMPELDGLEATKEIRQAEKELGGHVPIIALTAGAFKEEEEKCSAAGMDDFLTKPIEADKLKTLLIKYHSI